VGSLGRRRIPRVSQGEAIELCSEPAQCARVARGALLTRRRRFGGAGAEEAEVPALDADAAMGR